MEGFISKKRTGRKYLLLPVSWPTAPNMHLFYGPFRMLDVLLVLVIRRPTRWIMHLMKRTMMDEEGADIVGETKALIL
jgi:hypothetical protein